MCPEKKLEQLLKEVGAVRRNGTKKHLRYDLPNGKTFTVSATPSDWRAMHKAYADLRRMMGLTPTEAKEGVPREKKERPKVAQPRQEFRQLVHDRGYDFRNQLAHAVEAAGFESLMLSEGAKRLKRN